MGGQRGDVAALLLENSITYLTLFLGLAHAGFVVAPMNPRLPDRENERLFDKMVPWCVITEDAHGIQVDVQRKAAASRPPLRNEDRCDAPLTDDDLFYLGWSSGTTGAPKGILRTHKSWTESFFGMTLEFGLRSDAVMLIPGPFCYSASLIAALHILFIGGTVETTRRFDAAWTARRLAESDINALFMVPTMYRDVVDAVSGNPQWSTGRSLTCVTAGDKMSLSIRRAWEKAYPGARLYEYFGSSEVGFVSVLSPDDARTDEPFVPNADSGSAARAACVDDMSRASSVGRPFFPAQVRVVNGEIQVKSGLGFAGYAGSFTHPDPSQDANRVVFRVPRDKALERQIKRPDGWLAPGDSGYLDDHGHLHVTGRASDLIICGGVNVYPSEIEQVVLTYPGVREVCVFALPDARLGEVPACAVVWEDDVANRDAEMEPLRQFLLQHLPGYKRPRAMFSCMKLPRNAAGKIVRSELARALREEGSETN